MLIVIFVIAAVTIWLLGSTDTPDPGWRCPQCNGSGRKLQGIAGTGNIWATCYHQ